MSFEYFGNRQKAEFNEKGEESSESTLKVKAGIRSYRVLKANVRNFDFK